MFTAISTTPTVPIARVPWLDPGIIMKTLDAGAYGIICPMVNNREDAERFVHACRYPPEGGRSLGPIRATLYAGADYPVKGAFGYNAVSLKRINDHTIEETDKRDGVVLDISTMKVSPDGKTMTIVDADQRANSTSTFVAKKQ